MRMSSRASASSSTTRTRRPLRTAGLTISRSSLRSTGIAACYIILGVATLIGCVAALWFFWDKIAPRLRRIPPPSPAASTGVSAHDRALIGNAMQELETNAQLLATPQYYTAPALRDDAWRQLQPGVAVPGALRAHLQGIYGDIRRAKDIHRLIQAATGDTMPELIAIKRHLERARAAIPQAVSGLRALIR